ncbi:unnamed protein product [Fraxinus pennsylvanica]|uniref:Uncharacterized protein n=1 Tax=Fraxinus pennsylvanica TaxID=56036 RepID=A0AAD2DM79_9LAMI|nr:unnamed protein product [Fraxinus pennsylvanica]
MFCYALFLKECYVGYKDPAAIGENYTRQEDLNFCCSKSLSGTGLVALATYLCPCLSDVSLENVAIHYKSLETLSLYSEFDHDGGFLSACKGWPLLNSLAKGCLLSTSVKLVFRNIEVRLCKLLEVFV